MVLGFKHQRTPERLFVHPLIKWNYTRKWAVLYVRSDVNVVDLIGTGSNYL
jgi:hypothetical protein